MFQIIRIFSNFSTLFNRIFEICRVVIMNETSFIIQHWAILIEINFYVKNKNLKNCVRDVKNIKQYLNVQSTTMIIKSFTTNAFFDFNFHHSTESSNMWSIYENVIFSMQMIIANAKQNDFVYLHYFEHETQLLITTNKYSNKNTNDFVLILFDDVRENRYFRKLKLANLIQKMMKKFFLSQSFSIVVFSKMSYVVTIIFIMILMFELLIMIML